MLTTFETLARRLAGLRPQVTESLDEPIFRFRTLLKAGESRILVDVWHYFVSANASALGALGLHLKDNGWVFVAIYPNGDGTDFCLAIRDNKWHTEETLRSEMHGMVSVAAKFGVEQYCSAMVNGAT